ncbi:Succinate dehydrogenase/Fumarate reductase transmembrane subunit [Methyloligella halotolerans]|uniref:Succinate dehydrogenase hydrophobic membrane anchor subunit n=1 Tax=Methyloligella halotolerans TaxID=1177755 RepID=A0A1E2S139_9HYPH|nr:succinate dehydrogenase, hydrophobic membrane anchor protein [Methyloligella halotolerans]ODA68174.1 Succinate dehydrogenase/Fumarate reductase transmembrane subunit [Methyloligella halotolerans]
MPTPLAQARGLGAAHKGPETFWRQRLTAVANIPLVLFLILSILLHIGSPYEEVRTYLANPIVAVLMLGLVLSATIHLRIGLKEIVEDYIHGDALRMTMLFLSGFFAIGVGLASALAIIKISLGS